MSVISVCPQEYSVFKGSYSAGFLFLNKIKGVKMINTNDAIEYNKILEMLSERALSEQAKNRLRLLLPFLSESECKRNTNETTEARLILEKFASPPLVFMKDIDKLLILCEKGSMLMPEQLSGIAQFINSCKRMKTYLKKAAELNISVACYGFSFYDLDDLYNEIDRLIRNGKVDDHASAALHNLRRKIESTNTEIKTKLENMLRSKKEWFSDGYVASREGRNVLPVKKEYKNQVSGSVLDVSGTGSTYFIEPAQVKKLTEELNQLQIEEENEVRRILYTLTALVDSYNKELKINIDCMETLDFIFAKAKLSIEMKAIPAVINTCRKIKIIHGRHPLLKAEDCVPLDFEIGGDSHIIGVIITGPNTGGKTVALKTVGLLSLMAQSGLHVPAEEGSEFCMNADIMCDIGDRQSISENLSTFSAHMTNII
ncbi:MAG: MutS domain, partial [Clostridia bacterium]|nr:MutS domain [Clostridia bacterium]